MKLIKSTFVAAIGLLLFSCGNNTSEEATKPETAMHEAHHHHENAEAIGLDNGERWPVNEEMKPHISGAEEILDAYTTSGSADYKGLAAQLKEKNSALVKSCTMDGKSHDELHKWLHPHMELIALLSEAENEADAAKLVSEIKVSFQTYHTYFQ